MNNMLEFKKQRYVLIKNFFDPKNLSKETNKIILQAKEKKWKFVKIYYNAYISKFLNIFAISYPLNNFFESNFDKELLNINYKNKVKEITSWKEIRTTGIEIQHNIKYNYQSTWHRDWSYCPSECLNIIIYLKDEIGLRIVPYDKNNELDKFISIEKKGYMNIPSSFYNIIDAKAGDILIMDSGLLHQGFAKGNRTHIFIRTEEKKEKVVPINNFENDYSVEEYLKSNLDISKLNTLSKKDSYNFEINYYSFNNKIKSLLLTFLYYFPILKFFKYLKDFKKKKIHFHYTFFQ